MRFERLVTMQFGLVFSCVFALTVLGLHASTCTAQNSVSSESYSSGGGGSGYRSSSRGDGTWEIEQYGMSGEGYGKRNSNATTFKVEIEKPELDKFGNRLTLKGRFKYQSNNQWKPVNWVQGVTILLSMDRSETQKWPQHQFTEATLSDTVLLEADGSFSVEFDLRKTKRDPSVGKEFQFGVTFAKTNTSKKKRHSVTWRSDDPLQKTMTQGIQIPASKPLPHELRLVDQARGWPFTDPDGTKLIRAVNALHGMGKKKAIQSLREFLESPVDYHEHEIVFWILRSLFEPGDLKARSFRPMIFVGLYVDPKTQRQLWPWDPMDVVDEIPFMIGRQINGGGQPEHPLSHLNWFEKHGVLRQSPLSPNVNPLVVADLLIKSKKFQTLENPKSATRMIRTQALAMVGVSADGDSAYMTDKAPWASLLKSKLGTKVWNPDKQSFEPPKTKTKTK